MGISGGQADTILLMQLYCISIISNHLESQFFRRSLSDFHIREWVSHRQAKSTVPSTDFLEYLIFLLTQPMLISPAVLPDAALQFRIHPGKHLFSRNSIDRTGIRNLFEPVIRRNRHGNSLLLRRHIFTHWEIHDRFVIAGAHFHDFAVDIAIIVALPDLDYLDSTKIGSGNGVGGANNQQISFSQITSMNYHEKHSTKTHWSIVMICNKKLWFFESFKNYWLFGERWKQATSWIMINFYKRPLCNLSPPCLYKLPYGPVGFFDLLFLQAYSEMRCLIGMAVRGWKGYNSPY